MEYLITVIAGKPSKVSHCFDTVWDEVHVNKRHREYVENLTQRIKVKTEGSNICSHILPFWVLLRHHIYQVISNLTPLFALEMTALHKDPEIRFVTAMLTYLSYFIMIVVSLLRSPLPPHHFWSLASILVHFRSVTSEILEHQ